MEAISFTVSAPELMLAKLPDRLHASFRIRSGNKISFSDAKRKIWKGEQRYLAMYSSVFCGTVTDPTAMFVPVDDHMVHRGHGIFDTTAIMDGYLYELDQHLDRILRSASIAKIPVPFDRETMKGSGAFQLSPSGFPEPALYAIAIQDESPFDSRGIKVVTLSIPIKPPQFATMKSMNYLPNTLSKIEAEENTANAAIWLGAEGFVAEGPNKNVAFVTGENKLLMPHFEKILSGCTAMKVLTLAEKLVHKGKLEGIRVESFTVKGR